MLKFKAKTFPVKNATLSGAIPDPYWVGEYSPSEPEGVCWMLHVICGSEDQEDGANLTSEVIRMSSKSWKNLEGTSVAWKTPYDEQGDPFGSILADYEDEDIAEGTIVFGKRNGVNYELTWKGICGKPFSLSASVEFTGITVRASEKDSDASILARISEFLEPEEFEIGNLEISTNAYQSGVKMASVRLLPKPD